MIWSKKVESYRSSQFKAVPRMAPGNHQFGAIGWLKDYIAYRNYDWLRDKPDPIIYGIAMGFHEYFLKHSDEVKQVVEQRGKRASVINYVMPTLDPAIWENGEKIWPVIKEQILVKLFDALNAEGFVNYPNWIYNIRILGSLTSYQYLSTSDIDVHVETSLSDIIKVEPKFSGYTMEQMQAYLDELRTKINKDKKENVIGTSHPIEYFFETELAHAISYDGIYNLTSGEWEQPTHTVDKDYDVEMAQSAIVEAANVVMGEYDEEIGNLRRNIVTVEDIYEALDQWKNNEEHVLFLKDKIDSKLKEIEDSIIILIGKGKELIDERHKTYAPFGDINIIFKFLQKHGYLKLGSMLENILDKGIDQSTIEEIQDIIGDLPYQKEAKTKEELHEEVEELKEKLYYDNLTKLYSRHWLDKNEKDIMKDYDYLLLTDIDNFKKINDEYGHDKGDLVLKRIADLLKEVSIEFPVIRWGGEEMLIPIKADNEDETIDWSQKIVDHISTSTITDDIPVTISLGAAPIEKSIDETFVLADKALYESKNKGKNTWTIYTSELEKNSCYHSGKDMKIESDDQSADYEVTKYAPAGPYKHYAELNKTSGFQPSAWISPNGRVSHWDRHDQIYWSGPDKEMPKELIEEIDEFVEKKETEGREEGWSEDRLADEIDGGVMDMVGDLVDYGWIRMADWDREVIIQAKDKNTILRQEEKILPYIKDRNNIRFDVGGEDIVLGWIDIENKGLEDALKVRVYADLKHPKTIVIEPNEFYKEGLNEQEVFDYYDKVKDLIIDQYKKYDFDAALFMNRDGMVFKRRGEGEILQLKTIKEFDHLNNGRNVEFHTVIPGDKTKIVWIDLDPKEKFPFKNAKEIAIKLSERLEEYFDDIIDTQIRFSGSKGFHVVGFLKENKDVDTLREQTKDFLQEYIDEKNDDRLKIGITKDPDSIRLDTSTLHKSGSIRAMYSLSGKTGLVCLLLDKNKVKDFEKSDAKIDNVLKSLKRSSFIKEKDNPLTEFLEDYKAKMSMRFYTFDDLQENIGDKKCVISVKIDGEIIVWEYFEGKFKTYTRKGTLRTDLPVTNQAAEILSKKGIKHAVGVGEIYGVDEKGIPQSYLQSQSLLKKPKKEDEERIRIIVFDIDEVDDSKDMIDKVKYQERTEKIKTLFDKGKLITPAIFETGGIEEIQDLWEKVLQFDKYGWEGLVLTFSDGKIWKVKPLLSIDLVVVAIEKSETHKDWMGAILSSFMDKEHRFRLNGKIGTGFSHDERKDWLEWAEKNKVEEDDKFIWVDPYKDPRIVEIIAEEVNIKEKPTYKFDKGKWIKIEDNMSGVLRKPRLDKMRDDKKVNPQDLRMEQIPGWDSKESSLKEYKEKRDFDKTPEPEPEIKKEGKSGIQLHMAKKAGKHFDWRLYKDGVLKSGVTRSIPDPGEKVLFIETEDHPVDYLDFEGEIPAGEYGAGTVEQYDIGDAKIEEWGKDKRKFTVDFKKIKGEFTLIHREDNKWLMVRSKEKKESSQVIAFEKGDRIKTKIDNIPGTIVDRAPSNRGGTSHDVDFVIKWDKPLEGEEMTEVHPTEIEHIEMKKEASVQSILKLVVDLISPFTWLFLQNPKLKQAYNLIVEYLKGAKASIKNKSMWEGYDREILNVEFRQYIKDNNIDIMDIDFSDALKIIKGYRNHY